MSLLLKALEKSEEEKKDGEAPAASEQGQAAAGGGFKLSGGQEAPKSKLGSAIASRQVKSEDAERVVAAYEQAVEDDTDLVAASRKQNIKRLVFVLVVAGVAIGGFYAYEQFAPDLFGTDQVASTTSSQTTEVAGEATAEQAQLLPLPEPIYDIQESILIASLDPSASVSTDDTAEDNIAKQVTDVVASIIQEQQDEERRNFLLSQVEINEQESLEDEIEDLLSQSFDPETARNISTLDEIAMLGDLDSLSNRVYENKNFTVKPTNHVAKAVAGDDAVAAEQPAKAAAEVIQLTANDDKTRDLIEQGGLNYRYGNLLEAEKAFRAVIASQPTNINALLGLAKVHQSRGNRKLALSTLLKASEYAPNDPNIAGELIALQAESASPEVVEQRILAMLGRADSPAVRAKLLFALGNAYARNQSWLEARNAYRAANELNRSNPDYLFNLAVMSDYMLDREGALRYYLGALDASRSNPSSFDHEAARKRISELESVL